MCADILKVFGQQEVRLLLLGLQARMKDVAAGGVENLPFVRATRRILYSVHHDFVLSPFTQSSSFAIHQHGNVSSHTERLLLAVMEASVKFGDWRRELYIGSH